MENAPNQPENEPRKITPVIDYFIKVYHNRQSFSDVVMATSALLDKTEVDDKPTIEEVAASGFMPFEWEVDNDPRIAKEKLALLPVACLSGYIDNSTMKIDEVKQWYSEAFGGVMLLNSDADGNKEHSNACLSVQNSNHKMCDKSTICPYRYLEGFVDKSLSSPDFSQPMYSDDPKIGYETTVAKLHAGVTIGIIGENQKTMLSGVYMRKYLAYMNSRSEQRSRR